MNKENKKKRKLNLSKLPDLEKKPRLLFRRISFIGIMMLTINIGIIMFQQGIFSQGLTGFSIRETLNSTIKNTLEMTFIMKIFLISQWTLLFLILIYSAFKDKNILNEKQDEKELHIQKNLNKNKTDLDILYEVLQKKRELKISSICKAFKIDKEVAMEWGKILESGNLAEIDYPGFGQPVIKMCQDSKKEIKTLIDKPQSKTKTNKKKIKNKKIEKKNSLPLPRISQKEIKKIKKEVKKSKNKKISKKK